MSKKFKVNFKIKKDVYCSCCDEYHTHAVLKNERGFTYYVCLNCCYKTGSDYHTYSCPKCHTESSRSDWGSVCVIGEDNCDKECKLVTNFPFKITKRPCENCEHNIKDKEEYSFVKEKDSSYISNSMACGYDWTEVHKCLHCGEEYEFSNSSY